MRYLSRNDLEKIATRVFNDYKHLPQFVDRQVDRVDPEILACELCGLHIDYFHLSKDGLTLGMTAFKEVGVELYDDISISTKNFSGSLGNHWHRSGKKVSCLSFPRCEGAIPLYWP